MSKTLADRIEELAEKATPRPWKITEGHAPGSVTVRVDGDFPKPVLEIWHNGDAPQDNAALVTELVNNLPAILTALRSGSGNGEEPETRGPYEARLCKDIPADCCDYGVVSLSEGREVCRVWREQDARAIAAALSASKTGEGWKPIETYPYGTREPTYHGPLRGPRCLVFVPDWRISAIGVGKQDHTGDTAFDIEGIALSRLIKPTHWMPLPSDPSLPSSMKEDEKGAPCGSGSRPDGSSPSVSTLTRFDPLRKTDITQAQGGADE